MFDYVKKYINHCIAYAKLEVTDSVSNMIGAGVYGVFVGVCSLMVLFMGSIAGVFFLSDLLNDTATGILVLLGFYILLFILFMLFRKKIILLFTNNVVEAAMEAMDESENEAYEN